MTFSQYQRGAKDTAADERGTHVRGDKGGDLKDDKEFGVEVRVRFVHSCNSIELNTDTTQSDKHYFVTLYLIDRM